MSEAKSSDKSRAPTRELAGALLELFELAVATAVVRGDNVELLGAWADEWKPRLERLIRGS